MSDVLAAPAKLTTTLAVTGRREDGYHVIEADMVTIDLADQVELLPAQGDGSLRVLDEVEWIGLPGTAPDDDAGPRGSGPNLVEAALAACGRSADCVLRKRIPAGAGLGGGSADAAAVLRWAGVTDLQMAARLGADVPFCLVGGRARVRGIGETVEPLGDLPDDVAYLLVTPRLHVSTPLVYTAWDELGGPRSESGNDLEPAALSAYPGLRWWRDLMAAAVGTRPRLAGSGGTWFTEGTATRLEELCDQIRGEVVAGRESALVTCARSAMREGA